MRNGAGPVAAIAFLCRLSQFQPRSSELDYGESGRVINKRNDRAALRVMVFQGFSFVQVSRARTVRAMTRRVDVVVRR